jgi:dUTP pyrophosphatase
MNLKEFHEQAVPPVVKFKKVQSTATIPTRGTSVAAGLDLYSSEAATVEPGQRCMVNTGLKMELPRGYEGQVRPRSGNAVKFGVTVLNSPGTIDEDYRGEIKVLLYNTSPSTFVVNPGDRIAQLVIAAVSYMPPVEVDELSDTDRGEKGWGSTGR